MSLDFDLTDLDPAKRAEVFPPDEAGRMNDALHVLIWITMGIGIGEITPDNVDEFWTRVYIYQRITGSSGFNKAVPRDDDPDVYDWQPFLLERRHVEAAVGLSTNVFPKVPKGEWLKRIYKIAEGQAKHEAEVVS